MDTHYTGQLPATDDQELAEVLAGMNQQAADQPVADQPSDDQPVTDQPAPDVSDGMQFEETGATPPVLPEPPAETPPAETPPVEPPAEPVVAPVIEQAPEPETVPAPEPPAEPVIAPISEPEPTIEPSVDTSPSAASPELEAIKKDALEQLRPLVDKLDLPAQERFDTLLLIIRSTDDQSLVSAANDAAKAIEDDAKRAEALLDVIKEIDFFSHPAQ